jgi:hypothetical protein
MNRTEELKEALLYHPDHELIFMYPEESSDHPYTLGTPVGVKIDKYWTDDDKVWLYKKDFDDMMDHYTDVFSDKYYASNRMTLTDEQYERLEEEAEDFVENQSWRKCICVIIQP